MATRARMRIIVFLHGTTIMHRGAIGVPVEEVSRRVIRGEDNSVSDFESYVPVGNAVRKLANWRDQGADLLYFSSHRTPADVEKDRLVMSRYGFPVGTILYRSIEGESYASIAEKVSPDAIVEDDCVSIGGEPEMIHPNMSGEARKKVKSIVVREFGGIDHLPDDLDKLRVWPSRPP